MTTCHCNSEKEFDHCCGPYLAGQTVAPTAEALMRSRYSAYVLEDQDYLQRTCHPDNQTDAESFEDDTEVQWQGLEIVYTEAGQENDHQGIVEFKACYRVKGADYCQHEKSYFTRENEQWFYTRGEFVKPEPVRTEKIGRNSPCPCGSGKKFKKCCLGKSSS
ncbi:YchJ family protein [Thermodesulfobacteriota bacterium]